MDKLNFGMMESREVELTRSLTLKKRGKNRKKIDFFSRNAKMLLSFHFINEIVVTFFLG